MATSKSVVVTGLDEHEHDSLDDTYKELLRKAGSDKVLGRLLKERSVTVRVVKGFTVELFDIMNIPYPPE